MNTIDELRKKVVRTDRDIVFTMILVGVLLAAMLVFWAIKDYAFEHRTGPDDTVAFYQFSIAYVWSILIAGFVVGTLIWLIVLIVRRILTARTLNRTIGSFHEVVEARSVAEHSSEETVDTDHAK